MLRLNSLATEEDEDSEIITVPAPTWLRAVLAEVINEEHLDQFAELPEVVESALTKWYQEAVEAGVEIAGKPDETAVLNLVSNFPNYFGRIDNRDVTLKMFGTSRDKLVETEKTFHAEEKTWQQFFDEIDEIMEALGIALSEKINVGRDFEEAKRNGLMSFPIIVELIKRGYQLNEMSVNLDT
ncbi:MAG: hypothetical protein Q8P68_02425 [Candidatus Peregrinibacteria bacterium]|nr:hypothetical protein [Candidatus Peregrinibacteria bacterium]MDZ4245098.1 hypothetical protein [Candidatus Gracilibacteria bacterium]